ncbi:MAG TPA: hypothetical protein VIJ75_01540 [Hanamia sp.]
MKQAKKTTRNMALGLLSLCIMGTSTPTFARLKTGDPTELKFIGKSESQPVFQLNLNNSDSAQYLISITDYEDNKLLSEKVSGVNISRNYRIAGNEDDLQSDLFGITIEVTNLESNTTKVYKVSSKTKVTQDFVVAKL